MSLRIYNTLTRTKDVFEPVVPGKVGMYVCGPTVYASPHIGHLVGPVLFDVIKRYLVYKGFSVYLVVNITDVDDKLIAASREQQTSVEEIARRYTAEYQRALERLRIDTINEFPAVSGHMPEIIAMIQRLIDRNHAYVVDGNVWFDVASDPHYGRLSGRSTEQQQAGTRETLSDSKRNAADFALWKSAKPGEPAWSSPWGDGRPGWHIECSAMSMKILGETFDLHGGGDDLKFPHHENELAQSECATGKTFARFWLHNGLTRIRTKSKSGEWQQEKMSKSLGNVIGAHALLDEHGPDLLRYLLLSTHYRSPIEFSDEVIANCRKAMQSFHRLYERAARIGATPNEKTQEVDQASRTMLDTAAADFIRKLLQLKMRYMESMDDDFNTAGAIAVMHEIASEINAYIAQTRLEYQPSDLPKQAVATGWATLAGLARLLGLRLDPPGDASDNEGSSDLATKLIAILIDVRNQARAAKQFAIADAVRNQLKDAGISLEDSPAGTIWRKG